MPGLGGPSANGPDPARPSNRQVPATLEWRPRLVAYNLAMIRPVSLLLAASCTLFPMQTTGKRIISGTTASTVPYSPAVVAGGLIYVSGALAQDDTGAIVGADIGAQTTRVIERLRGVLERAGSSLEQVVSATVYLKSAGDFAAMNAAYGKFWTKDPPTRTTIVAELVRPEALVEISMIAVPTGAARVVIHPESWQRSPSPYSYAIRAADTVFFSGLVSRNGRDNSMVEGDVRVQTRTVMQNARELLEAAGLTFDHVVSARVYLPDAGNFAAMNEEYRGVFSGAKPVRAAVVAGLAGPQYSVEITLTATTVKPTPVDTGGRPSANLSAALRAGNRVFLSGMLGATDQNAQDAGAQTTETLARARAALEAARCTPADVVDSLIYLTDLANFQAMNAAYRAVFPDRFPARATVKTGLFAPTGLVEIMLTAVCD
jgi:2-iminobutanoate/2-iminopropanoate deaminase